MDKIGILRCEVIQMLSIKVPFSASNFHDCVSKVMVIAKKAHVLHCCQSYLPFHRLFIITSFPLEYTEDLEVLLRRF